MNPFALMREWFLWATQVLVDAALTCYGFVWPFSYIGGVFNALSSFTSGVAGELWSLANQWTSMVDVINKILAEINFLGYVKALWNQITAVVSWFANWTSNVQAVIGAWWASASSGVQALINAAIAPFAAVKVAWDNFWVNLYPGLLRSVDLAAWWNSRLLDVQGLISSAIAAAAPFWAGWQEIRATVLEFFADPIEWLWGKFTDWFLGPEE